MKKKTQPVRMRAVQFAFGFGFLLILGRAAQVQLFQGKEYEAQAQEKRTRLASLPARRGGIFDRVRSPLALTEDVYHVDATIAEFKDTAATVEALSTHLGIPARAVRDELRNRYAYFHGPFDADQVKPLRQIRGVHLTPEPQRFSPHASLARSIIGSPKRDTVSARGLERVLDTLLTGVPGEAVVLKDQFGREHVSPRRLNAFPISGHDVYLTIDADIQDLVEQALTEAIDLYGAIGGDVVIMQVKTGHILAAASRTENRSWSAGVFFSTFQPGSTAKLFAAAALLSHNRVSETDSVFGENGEWTVGVQTIRDDHEEGWMRLTDVIRRSSNIGIAKFVRRLTREEQFETVRRFGIGSPTGVEISFEAAGTLYHPHEWSSTSSASLSYGYEMAVTMIQLAQAYAAIGNDGVMLRPTLISRVFDPEGREIYTHRPEPIRRVVTPEVAAALREMLRRVVDSGGTAESAIMSVGVAGKTGTARRVVDKRYQPGSYTASFVAMVPAEDPQIVIAVKLDDPEAVYSTATAVPFTRSMLEQLRAADNTAFDRSRLGAGSDAPTPRPPTGTGAIPYVTDWPAFVVPGKAQPRPIPDVVGLSPREAARRLHELGFSVRMRGWGGIDSVVPGPGVVVEPGTTVSVYSSGPGGS